MNKFIVFLVSLSRLPCLHDHPANRPRSRQYQKDDV